MEPVEEQKNEVPLAVSVSEDKLKAYILATGDLSGLTVEGVKNVLKENKIVFGMIDDGQIEKYLATGSLPWEPLLAAEGEPAKPGQDARISYFFDRDPLRIGTIRQDGVMDFKDKGEIPQVKEGILLAEKFPVVKAEPGMDVYGNPIPATEPMDLPFLSGSGTKKSEDGLKIYAQTSGRPQLLADGKLCVFSEITIEGEVGLGTGNIRFDGFIDVSGGIREGFRVQGGKLSTKEIDRAEVAIEGDIIVDGGIIGAKVSSKGNLKARYIRSSHLEVLGNVVVEGEVIDSTIQTQGAFVINDPRGKIFSSQIKAGKGIEANQIGSDSSRPCTLTLGGDSATKSLVDKLAAEGAGLKAEQERLAGLVESLQKDSIRLSTDIGRLAQVQDRSAVEQRAWQKRIEEFKNNKDLAGLAQAEKEIRILKAKIQAVEKPLGRLMEEQDQVTEKISTCRQKIEASKKRAQDLGEEISGVLDLAKKRNNLPVLKVHGSIFSGTVIEGYRASLQLTETLEYVSIRESNVTPPTAEGRARSEWKMGISSLS